MIRRMAVSVLIMALLCCALAFVLPPIANEATISVSLSAASMTFPGDMDLGLGDSWALSVGADFASSDESVATVSVTGLVRAVGMGECVISASAESGEIMEMDLRVLPAPQRVELSFADDHLGVGEKAAFVARAYMLNGDATAAGFTFTTSDRAVATVSDEGVVSARKVGRAKITVTTYNGLTTYVNITVRESPDWLRLEDERIELGAGEVRSVSVKLPKGSAGQYTLESSDESVLKVMGRDIIAAAPGTAEITARAYNGKSASCEAVVHGAPSGVMLSCADFALGVGQRFVLGYSLSGEDAGGGVKWYASDNSIAKIDAAGGVTALSVGECEIYCVAYNGHTAQAHLRVLPAPTGLKVSPGVVKLGVSEEYSIKPIIDAGSAAGISYSSTNSNIASVSDTGLVLARGRGEAVITVTTHNGLKDTLSVSVKKAPGYVAFNYDPLTVYVGESVRVFARMSKGAASAIKYSSSDRSVARFSASGRLTGVSQGEATLRIETYNGLSAECTVQVYEPAALIDAPDEVSAVAGAVLEMPVCVYTASGDEYAGDIQWESADPDVAYADGGVITPLKAGTTYITVSAHDIEKTIKVNVGAYFAAEGMRVAAHRGDVSAGTENTLSAIRGAVEAGADYVEVDVRATADGELVLMHDSGLLRLARKTGSVAKTTLSRLRTINLSGGRVCALDEALEYLSTTDADMLLEIKVKGIEEACVRAVEAHGMTGRVTYISFYMDSLTAVRACQSGARVGYLYSANITDPAAIARNFDVDVMIPYMAYIDEDYVSRLHAAGAEVGAWTVNNSKMLRRMRAAGVDIVITDTLPAALNIAGKAEDLK